MYILPEIQILIYKIAWVGPPILPRLECSVYAQCAQLGRGTSLQSIHCFGPAHTWNHAHATQPRITLPAYTEVVGSTRGWPYSEIEVANGHPGNMSLLNC